MNHIPFAIHRGKRGGFTLVEILVVSILLALLSGLVVFNVQQAFNSNLRKAIILETSSIGTASSLAHNDLGFFPNFNYLEQPSAFVRQSTGEFRADLDFMGFYLPTAGSGGSSLPNRVNPPGTLFDRWQKGGYMAASASRASIATRKSGTAKVRLPTGRVNPSLEQAGQNSLVDWPVDAWGNPYVLYLLKTNLKDDGTFEDPRWRFIESPTEDPDFKAMVVSYGPNGIPGSVVELAPGTNIVRETRSDLKPGGALAVARLFLDGDVDDSGQATNGGAQFTLLLPRDYTVDVRIRIVQNASKAALGINLTDELRGIPAENLDIRGILDPGSDDIVFVL